MKYQPPFDPGFAGPIDGIYNSDPDAPHRNGNPATGDEGSIPPFESVEHPMRELVHLIEYSGQDPSHTDLEQVRKAIKWIVDNLINFAKSGDGVDLYHGNSANTYFFRSLVAGDNITLSVLTDGETGRTSIKIDAAGGGGDPSGEANNGANVGGAVEVFKQKNALNLEFRTLEAGAGMSVAPVGDKIVISNTASPSLSTVAPMMLLQQVRAYNAAPAAMTESVYNKRALTTEVANQIPDASFNSGTAQITLPAGTYRVNFAAVGYNCGHRARLFNVTGNAEVVGGCSIDSWVSSSFGIGAASTGCGRFTIENESVLELQSYAFGGIPRVGDTVSSVNFGNFIDAWIEIVKEG